MKIKSLAVSTLALMSLAAPVFAGSPAPAPADSVVPPVLPVSADWTGPYVGLELGYADATASNGIVSVSDNAALYGATLGYDHDFGNWVFGGSLDYAITDLTFGGINVDNVARLKLRGGIDMGDGLLYAAAGAARASTNVLGSDTGWLAGVGYEHRLGSNWSVGGEALYHKFDNFGGTVIDVEATTLSLRALYRF